MKFAVIAKTKKKAESIVGILFLIFLSYGCNARITQTGHNLNCSKAETAVNQAQQQYDVASQVLGKQPTDVKSKRNVAQKATTLEAAQQDAFEKCQPVNR